MTLSIPMLALLTFSVAVLIIGLIAWLGFKRPSGRALTAMGVGLLVTFAFYFAFTATGIYGKPGAAAGYALNIVGLIVLLLGASTAIYHIKKVRAAEAKPSGGGIPCL